MFKKEVTTKLIGEYLDRYGWNSHRELPEPGEKEGLVGAGYNVGGEDHVMFIDPILEKNAVVFRVGAVASAPADSTASDRLNGLLLSMAALNYKLILGHWAYDPRDGEVVFKASIPIDGGELDYKQFEHCLLGVVAAVETDGRKLKGIVDGTIASDEVLKDEQLPLGGPVGTDT